MIMNQDFYKKDEHCSGVKGLVYIGDKLLVYRRDYNTDKYPGCIDFPGGGKDGDETPFENYKREISEEFSINVDEDDIVYVRQYPSVSKKDKHVYFPVAKLETKAEGEIALGDEGLEFSLISEDEYLAMDDVAWPDVFKERVETYLASSKE